MNNIANSDDKDALYYVSIVFGWIYFAAWSLSFYGQPIENYRRHKVNGLNFDYEVYNLVGYAGYTTYTIWGYKDNNLGTGIVQIQDILFSAHGFFMTCVIISQIVYYYDKTDPNQRVNYFTICFLLMIVYGAILLLIVEQALKSYDPHGKSFNSLIYMGWSKVIITLVKYIPQAYSNFKRKSTIGWNIHNILLDFTGGIFSFAQTIVDTARDKKDKNGDEGEDEPQSLNTAKFALGFITIFFDILFIMQHYWFYRDSNSDLGDNNKQNNKNNKLIDKIDDIEDEAMKDVY